MTGGAVYRFCASSDGNRAGDRCKLRFSYLCGLFENLATVAANPNYFFELADVKNREQLDVIFEKHKPDAVMHLAADRMLTDQ